ncbi:MAG: glycosyltransferase family 1 protein, partial [Bacteroidales bacterium]|nr:glycosyltransferase family 1 protein [Bacteroidales bacterium]
AIYDEEIIACYLKNATLCVSPGNVGLTAIHALSYGLPVVTNDNFVTQMPEYEAIEQGLSGDFFHENDTDSLVAIIEKWLYENRWSREEIRTNCYRRIDEHYNCEEQIRVFKKVLNR